MDHPRLQLKNICLKINSRSILQNVNFTLLPGEIHALVGEHRAGKTPLIKIITGELAPDSGSYYLNNQLITEMTTESALKMKIGAIYQEPQIIPNISALENILAGTIPGGRIRHNYLLEQIKRCRTVLDTIGLDIDLEMLMEQLSPTEQHMVELARLYYLDCDILILDDISGRLTPREMGLLQEVLTISRDQGKSILFTDSNVDNIIELADRVTILHNGVSGGTEKVKDLDRLKLLKLTYNFALSQSEEARDASLVLNPQINQNLMANLPAGVAVFNGEQTLTSINKAALKILEKEEQNLIGLKAEDIIREEEIGQASRILQAMEDRKETTFDNTPFCQKKFLRIKMIPYKDSSGMIKGTMLMVEEVVMDNILKEYLVRAEKISSIAELASGVSHEINNPLGIINNYLQLLLFRKLDQDSMEKLKKIQIQINRITDITSSLFSFSRLKQVPDRKFDLKQLLEEVLLLLSHNLKEKNVSVIKEFPQRTVSIKGNENRLRQVFVNLVNNSIEALQPNGIIHLDAQEDKQNNYVQVLISDNGYGIPLEIQREIFSPFFTTKIKKENAGLGLSICQHIIDAHKGLMTFESSPGEKTTFKIKLPIE